MPGGQMQEPFIGTTSVTSQPPGQDSVVDLWAFVVGLWRRRWLILASTILVAVASLVFSRLNPPLYQAATKVLVPSLEMAPGVQLTGSAFVAITQGQDLSAVVVKEFGLDRQPFSLSIDEFRRDRLTVGAIPDTNIALINVRLEDARKAADVANRIADLAIERTRRECDNGNAAELEATRARLEQSRGRLDAVQNKIAATSTGSNAGARGLTEAERITLEIEEQRARILYLDVASRVEKERRYESFRFSQLRVFDRALPPGRPLGAGVFARTIAAAVVGYFLAVIGVLLFDAFRMTVLRVRA